MKTLYDYMKVSYRVEIIEYKDEGGYVVSYPDLWAVLHVEKRLKLWLQMW